MIKPLYRVNRKFSNMSQFTWKRGVFRDSVRGRQIKIMDVEDKQKIIC